MLATALTVSKIEDKRTIHKYFGSKFIYRNSYPPTTIFHSLIHASELEISYSGQRSQWGIMVSMPHFHFCISNTNKLSFLKGNGCTLNDSTCGNSEAATALQIQPPGFSWESSSFCCMVAVSCNSPHWHHVLVSSEPDKSHEASLY